MRVSDYLAAQGLEVDDVRWYVASLLGSRLLSHKNRPAELTKLIWSGKLEAELYHAEERFLEELQRKADAGLMDEPALRELMREIAVEKRRRRA